VEPENPKNGFVQKTLRAGPYLIIVAAAALIYSTSLNVPFLFDDRLNILDNPYIRITELNLHQIKRAAVQDGFQMRLVSNLTFGLDYYFHGLSRKWMHIENIAIHALNAVLVYAIVLALLPLAGFARTGSGRRRAAALFAALAWSVHPAHTQAVTYLVQRHTLMAACGILSSFLFYLKARDAGSRTRRMAFTALALLSIIAGALSKETGFLAPAYIALFEIMVMRGVRPAERPRERVAALAVLFFFIGACTAVIYLVRSGILSAYFSSYQHLDYGPAERLLTESRVVFSYLLTMFFPHPCRLALEHETVVSSSLVSPWTTLPAVLLITGAIVASYVFRKRIPVSAFLTPAFILTLAPESSIIPVALMYDHRMYLLSLFILPPVVSWTAMNIETRKSLPLLAAAVFMSGGLSHSRNLAWSSAESLWSDSAKKSPGLFLVWSNLCAARLEAGHYAAAARYCGLATALGPEKAMPAVNRAVALWHMGGEDEAAAELERAAKRWPESALAQYNYGSYLEHEKRYEDAIEFYTRALESDPFHFRARLARAELYAGTGRGEKARDEFEALMSLFPDRAEQVKNSPAYP